MTRRPQVSFILATHNRRDVLLGTLERVVTCGLDRDDFEIIVVDNRSTDGTCQAVRETHPSVNLIPLGDNRGSCAKGLAIDRARGQYVVFLDDDSYPWAGLLQRMIEHFENDPRLGAAGFHVHLPDGRGECSALPSVFIGCGVGLRATALREVGGLDVSLFMQAEEYDLSFRLVSAGWRIRTFDDLHVDHLKTPQARTSARTTFYDTRNNLLLIERYLPEPHRLTYLQDWLQRYWWLACDNSHRASFVRAILSVWRRGSTQRRAYTRHRLSNAAFEELFLWEDIAHRLATLGRSGARRVLFADLGKNVFAYHRGALKSGLSVLAIADDRFAAPGRGYRGTPIIPVAEARNLNSDAIVVSNTSPVHAAETRDRLGPITPLPIYCWFGHQSSSTSTAISSDEPAYIRATSWSVGEKADYEPSRDRKAAV